MAQDLEGACGAQVDSSAESHDAQDAPLPVSPLPALPVAAVTPPPLPTRLLRSGGAGAAGRSTKAQGNFWWAKGSWAKAGLAMTSSRKKMEAAAASAAAAAAAATPSSAPVSPARGLRSAWSKNGGARTPPPSYGSATAGRAPGEAGGGVLSTNECGSLKQSSKQQHQQQRQHEHQFSTDNTQQQPQPRTTTMATTTAAAAATTPPTPQRPPPPSPA